MKLSIATKIEFIVNIVVYIILLPIAIIGLVFQKVADGMTWTVIKLNWFRFIIGNRLLKSCPDIPYSMKNEYTAMGYSKKIKLMSRAQKRKLNRELALKRKTLISYGRFNKSKAR